MSALLRFANRTPWLVLTLMAVTAGTVANACNIPVFRYALERWRADACRVLVFHDGPLSAADEALVRNLESSSTEHEGAANVEVVRLQIDQAGNIQPAQGLAAKSRSEQELAAEQADQELWNSLRRQGEVSLPYMVCQTSLPHGASVNHWQGALDAADELGLLSSPVRERVANRLLAGDSVVWLVMESSDQQASDQLCEQIEQQCEQLQSRLKLPEGVGLPGSELHSHVPLLLKFTVVRLDPRDPQEAFLVSLLTALRPQALAKDEPLAVPIFGRGRALEVIPASELSPALIEDLLVFLSGACSCQVKELNPGFDLLFSTDWNSELFPAGIVPPEDNPLLQQQRSPVLLTIPPGSK